MAVYTLFGQGSVGSPDGTDGNAETDGMQFTLSQSATLTGIWYYSPAGATGLVTGCAIFQVTGSGTGTVVPGSENDAPSWSGAAGSGWVKCAFSGGPVLAASTSYKVCILLGSSGNIYRPYTHHYWDSGPGASGLTSGIITAPNNAGGDHGQDTYAAQSSLAYPTGTYEANNYWVDVEVTTGSPPSGRKIRPRSSLPSLTTTLLSEGGAHGARHGPVHPGLGRDGDLHPAPG